MKYLLLLLFSTSAYSWTLNLSNREPMKVEQLSIEYREIEAWRNPYYENGKDDWRFTSDFTSSVLIYDLLYYQNKFHFSMDRSQIRHAGWQYYLGLKVTNWLRLFKYHHSEHMLEQTPASSERLFPVEDSYGFRIDFVPREN